DRLDHAAALQETRANTVSMLKSTNVGGTELASAPAVLVDKPRVSVHQAHFRPVIPDARQLLDRPRRVPVVVGGPGQVLASRLLKSVVQSGRQAPVWLASNHPHPRVGVVPQHRWCVIRGAV